MNKIKIVNNLDLFILGMPHLIQLQFSFNKMQQVNTGNISKYSKGLAKIVKILYNTDVIVNRFYRVIPNKTYALLLDDNQIEYVNFGLKALYEALMEVNDQISVDYLFRRVSSALLTNNKIKCTCSLFDDLNFLVNGVFNTSTSQYFKSLGTSLIANTQCETKENEKINLISNLKAGNLSRSQFCDSSKAVDQIYGLNYFFLYFINVLTLWHSV
jgi:hypothetical protein